MKGKNERGGDDGRSGENEEGGSHRRLQTHRAAPVVVNLPVGCKGARFELVVAAAAAAVRVDHASERAGEQGLFQLGSSPRRMSPLRKRDEGTEAGTRRRTLVDA